MLAFTVVAFDPAGAPRMCVCVWCGVCVCCAVLCCAVLCCAVLCCAVLCCAVVCCVVLFVFVCVCFGFVCVCVCAFVFLFVPVCVCVRMMCMTFTQSADIVFSQKQGTRRQPRRRDAVDAAMLHLHQLCFSLKGFTKNGGWNTKGCSQARWIAACRAGH